MGVTYIPLCVRESQVCVLAYSKVHFKLVFILFLIEEELVVTRWFTSEKQWHPTLVILPGKSHGWWSLVGCSPWGCEESDTEWLHFYFLLLCIGEGNGNPLQYSSLENPRDGGAWRPAVFGVTQSRTRLKRLSSSSSRRFTFLFFPDRPPSAEAWAMSLLFTVDGPIT